MANVLIVHAHPEPKSFSSALARTAAEALVEAGHQVVVSDLYAMGFDPVSSRKSFRTAANPDYFKPQAEERHAAAHDGFASELETEIRKLEACDLLIFSFPLWWFGLPAILKGWVDRVFTFGRIYGDGRWYDLGLGRGKRAMAILTTGSPASAFHRGGLHTDLETMLAPLHHGVFRFNGYAPLRPFITWSAAHITETARSKQLDSLRHRLAGVWDEQAASVPVIADYTPKTWTDRLPHFLVVARPRSDANPGELKLAERDCEVLRELRTNGQLIRAMLAEAGAPGWRAVFEVRSETLHTAVALFSELPLAAKCQLSGAPLDLRSEDALSPHWPNEVARTTAAAV